jgi:cell wall-associated NlpC family hydrolase
MTGDAKSRRAIFETGLAMAAGLATCPTAVTMALVEQGDPRYRSPYRLRFRRPVEELSVGFDREPWNSPRLESEVPHREWYSHEVRRKFGSWGPTARQYPPAPEIHRRSREWLQDRVVFTASRWLGIPYQHHHIPNWDPPADWPWKKVAYGRNSKGVDCSNFSSFYYNFGLGLKLDTGIRTQAERQSVRGPGGRGVLRIERIDKRPYEELVRLLEPGDLLYIRNKGGQVAHVIMFLGAVGESPDATPLVIDSTGGGHVDCERQKIPIGVHIRPFARNSWYYGSLAHAHRLVDGLSRIEEGIAEAVDEGGADEVTENG